MNKQQYVDADFKIVAFDFVDVIATSDSAEIPSTGGTENVLPSMGPNDTEIL